MENAKIYRMSFNKIYKCLTDKVEKKNKTKEELNEIIYWLTGHDERTLTEVFSKNFDMETFFKTAPLLNPLRKNIKGVICGVRVESIENETMQNIRYLDKLVDDLTKTKLKFCSETKV